MLNFQSVQFLNLEKKLQRPFMISELLIAPLFIKSLSSLTIGILYFLLKNKNTAS